MRSTIRYSEISKAATCLDKMKPIEVQLTQLQANYFKRHLEMMCRVPRLRGMRAFLDSVKFNVLQLIILLRCPRILELGLFYDIDRDTMNRVTFAAHDQGVLVTFLPRKSSEPATAANDPKGMG